MLVVSIELLLNETILVIIISILFFILAISIASFIRAAGRVLLVRFFIGSSYSIFTVSTKLRWHLLSLIMLQYLRVLILNIDCRRYLSPTRLYYCLFENPTLYKPLLWEGVFCVPFRSGRVLIIIVIPGIITSLLQGLHLLLLGHHGHPLF